MSLYRSCGIHSFFRVVKDGKCRTPSAVCSGERTSHTATPPPVGARLRAVSQRDSVVCRMMAEGDEYLELFPSSKNKKSAIWNFSGNVN